MAKPIDVDQRDGDRTERQRQRRVVRAIERVSALKREDEQVLQDDRRARTSSSSAPPPRARRAARAGSGGSGSPAAPTKAAIERQADQRIDAGKLRERTGRHRRRRRGTSPCARLTRRITPSTIDRPSAVSARMPPSSTPETRLLSASASSGNRGLRARHRRIRPFAA